MKKQRYAAASRALILPVIIVAIWELSASFELVLPVFLPSPLAVLRALGRSISDGRLFVDVAASCYRVAVGFLISVFAAVPLGALMGSSRWFRSYVEPLNDFIRYIPVPAMVPLLILWLGIDDWCQIGVIVFGTLPQLLVMVVDSVSRLPPTYVDICTVLKLNRWQTFFCVYIPYASPQIYDAARVCIGWAWSFLVVAEIIGADHGVGQGIIVAQRFLRTDQVMAGILVIALLGLLTDFLFRAFYPFLFPWAERTRQAEE